MYPSLLRSLCRRLVPRLAAVTLVALAWSCPAFCDAIHDAARDGDVPKVTALLRVDPRLALARDAKGDTPLHWAARNGHKDVAAVLVANKADVNAKNSEGETPLHCAVVNAHRDIVEYLLANKADVNAEGKQGWTPLDYADAEREVAALLRQNGGRVRDPSHEAAEEEEAWGHALQSKSSDGFVSFYKQFPATQRLTVLQGKIEVEVVMAVSDNGGGMTADTARSTVRLKFDGSPIGSMPLEAAKKLNLVDENSAGGFNSVALSAVRPNAKVIKLKDTGQIVAILAN
jgi:hypothetical protein